MADTLAYRAYRLFKYAIYALLALNVYWFFDLEWAAAGQRFAEGLPAANIVDAFAATIDTAAWVLLLLIFELETSVLEDRQLTPAVTGTLGALRILCYCIVIYSLSGYIVRLQYVDTAALLDGGTQLCALADAGWAYMRDLDQFIQLTGENCGALGQSPALFQLDSNKVVVNQQDLAATWRLAWVDVINSAAWLCVVFILDLDVRLQEKNRLRGAALITSTVTKSMLYAVLFAAAVYWGIRDTFVNFWDAFLWLLAFFFIELNILEWRKETSGSLSKHHAAAC